MKRKLKHLCDTCTKEFATCDAKNVRWGIDIDPSLRGKDADKVVRCDAYSEAITDGFGNYWPKRCPECGRMSMEVVRPGKAQCEYCG